MRVGELTGLTWQDVDMKKRIINVNHQLIGIRGRALNQDEVDVFGKYMPLEIENKWYAHPLSQNLYGLDLAKFNIQKKIYKIDFFYEPRTKENLERLPCFPSLS